MSAPAVERVSTATHDDVTASGWRATCAACGWQTPILVYEWGARRAAEQHRCPSVRHWNKPRHKWGSVTP